MEDGGAEGVPVPFNRATMAYPSLTYRSRKSEAPSQQPSPPHRSSVSKPPDKTTIGGEVNGIAKFRVHVTWFSSGGLCSPTLIVWGGVFRLLPTCIVQSWLD